MTLSLYSHFPSIKLLLLIFLLHLNISLLNPPIHSKSKLYLLPSILVNSIIILYSIIILSSILNPILFPHLIQQIIILINPMLFLFIPSLILINPYSNFNAIFLHLTHYIYHSNFSNSPLNLYSFSIISIFPHLYPLNSIITP
jgi:hypothetical protein